MQTKEQTSFQVEDSSDCVSATETRASPVDRCWREGGVSHDLRTVWNEHEKRAAWREEHDWADKEPSRQVRRTLACQSPASRVPPRRQSVQTGTLTATSKTSRAQLQGQDDRPLRVCSRAKWPSLLMPVGESPLLVLGASGELQQTERPLEKLESEETAETGAADLLLGSWRGRPGDRRIRLTVTRTPYDTVGERKRMA